MQGIALASDTNYKVLGAAYPWIARRLLTDTTPELRRWDGVGQGVGEGERQALGNLDRTLGCTFGEHN